MRSTFVVSAAMLVCLFLPMGCSSGSTAPPAAAPVAPAPPASPPVANIWVVAWGASPESATASTGNPGGAEQTYRSFFYPTVAGTMERVRFSNYFGTAPVTIGAARLAIAATPPAIDPGNDVALSFAGSASVTIAPGEEVTSDPVKISYAFGQKMAVTAYVQGSFAPLSQHDSQVITNYATAANAGNATSDAVGTSINQPNTEWFLLSGMDVYGAYQGTVAILGSSTIDGHNSDYGDTNAYPVANVPVAGQDNQRISDHLARILNAAGYHLGVLNAGILGDYAGPSSGSASGAAGLTGSTATFSISPASRRWSSIWARWTCG